MATVTHGPSGDGSEHCLVQAMLGIFHFLEDSIPGEKARWAVPEPADAGKGCGVAVEASVKPFFLSLKEIPLEGRSRLKTTLKFLKNNKKKPQSDFASSYKCSNRNQEPWSLNK